jgi:hypothetical protein
MPTPLKVIVANSDEALSPEAVTELSKELVIGIVGYAGAGCSTVVKRLEIILDEFGYKVERVKLSDLIEGHSSGTKTPKVEPGPQEGKMRFARAQALQDLGDGIRKDHGFHAISALAVKNIVARRGTEPPGERKLAFIIDSLKHPEEVDLLRRVYDMSFRLIAVHCERLIRESRLIGGKRAVVKFFGVPNEDVKRFMDRDEQDTSHKYGQQVRDAFYLADFFLDNNAPSQDGENLTGDLDRFVSLMLGAGLVRPNCGERAMYHAHAAALQSSCLSRQVGAALVSPEGNVVATGAKEVAGEIRTGR